MIHSNPNAESNGTIHAHEIFPDLFDSAMLYCTLIRHRIPLMPTLRFDPLIHKKSTPSALFSLLNFLSLSIFITSQLRLVISHVCKIHNVALQVAGIIF